MQATSNTMQEPVYTTNLAFMLHYSDGRVLQLATDRKEVYPDNEVTYGNLNREGLFAIEVHRKDKGLVFQMHIESDSRLIYTRRTIMKSGFEPMAFYILGWRKNVAGQNIQSINIIYENMDVIQSLPRFRQEAPFHEPDFTVAEK